KIVVDLREDIYNEFGVSEVFQQRWLDYKADVDGRGRFPTFMQFNFASDVDMRLEIEYLNSGGSSYFYYYDFDMVVEPETKEVRVTKRIRKEIRELIIMDNYPTACLGLKSFGFHI